MATSAACDARPENTSPIISSRRLRESRRTLRSTATRRLIRVLVKQRARMGAERMIDVDELTFEVERFEWAAEDRLEVSGRWFGGRGRRFMRPTLHLRVGGRRRRRL